MAPKFSVNFCEKVINGKAAKLDFCAINGKCHVFSVNDFAERKNFSEIELLPGKSVKKKWLYGPATCLASRSVMYPCTRYRSQVPCPCLLCHKKKHPTCRVLLASKACNCEDCFIHYEDHDSFHSTFHFGCKFCNALMNIFLDKVKEGIPTDNHIVMEWNQNLMKNQFSRVHLVSKLFHHDYRNSLMKETDDLKCYQCSKYFPSSSDLMKHIDSVHYEECYACKVCGKVFSRQDNLVRHRQVFHKSSEHGDLVNCQKSFQCALCIKSFLRKDILLRHQKIHDASEDPKLKCQVCGKQFNRETNFVRHMEVHKNVTKEKHQCELCNTNFTLKAHLQRHMLGVYGESGGFKNNCSQCDENFCTEKLLKAHVNSKHVDL